MDIVSKYCLYPWNQFLTELKNIYYLENKSQKLMTNRRPGHKAALWAAQVVKKK